MERQPILEALTRVRSRLLRVETVPGNRPAVTEGLALTFEHARLEVVPGSGGLHIELGAEAAPTAAVGAAEDEPWWAVIGAALCGAWSPGGAHDRDVLPGLDLQLRENDENPRLICIDRIPGGLRVRSMSRAEWLDGTPGPEAG